MRKTEEILNLFKDKSREDLIETILVLRAKMNIRRKESEWLDRLADELRDNCNNEESEVLYREYKALKVSAKKELMDIYGIDIDQH